MKPETQEVKPDPANEVKKPNWLKLVAILAAMAIGFMLLPEKWQFLVAASVVIACLLIPSGFIRSRDPLNTSYNVVRVALGLIFLWGAFAPKGLLYHNNGGYRYAVDLYWPWFEPPTIEELNRPYYKTLGQTPLYALFDSTSGPDSLITTLPAKTVVQVEIETAKTTGLGDEFIRVIYTAGSQRTNGWVKSNLLERAGPKDWQRYVASFTPPKPAPTAVQASQTRFPSVVAPDFTYEVSQENLKIGYANPGDVLTITPTLDSKITWDPSPYVSDGKNVGLNGAQRPATSCLQSEQFPAPDLPAAALLINVPGYDWQVLDRERVFTINQQGDIVLSLNDRRGCFHDNSGKVGIKARLLTGAST